MLSNAISAPGISSNFSDPERLFSGAKRQNGSFFLWIRKIVIECELRMRTYTVQNSGLLLETLLQAFADTKRTRVKQSLTHGGVLVNGRPVTRFDYPVKPGDLITFGTRRDDEGAKVPEFGVRILYEDDLLIAVEKPAGLLTVATDSVRERTAIYAVNDFLNLRERIRSEGGRRSKGPVRRRKLVFVVHRLDRGASGVLLFAKDVETKEWLQANWDRFSKTYQAVVEGAPAEEQGKVESYLKENKILRVESGPNSPGAKRAVTHYRVLKKNKSLSLIEVRLETGRKHQIRVHMADLGCPIAGDKDYGSTVNPARRLALHACRLEIEHPAQRRRVAFESPFPPELEALV